MSVSFAFRPRLLDALKGYTRARWFADLGAGITVGIVALPLAMAFAIASGLPPQSGLWTAIIGGALVALLGGSNVQIAGPAGAFIVIVYGIVQQHGVAGEQAAAQGARHERDQHGLLHRRQRGRRLQPWLWQIRHARPFMIEQIHRQVAGLYLTVAL